ncbi:hypothetical protein [Pedobacter steynii]|uniref:Uncharacterized protein n=1 Tax=Pedobacter steynii TaxID=430522 RepID=A0A1D7QN38_9SPHI|nr:hypothetical protein [Pedobacter steynii]AOM80082.1 hypothetical protein BFS30_24725 [Pedobacter steynii]
MEKKDRLEKLIGKTVMVPQFLTTDPANHRGDIGTVTAVHSYKDGYADISVSFKDGCGRYDAFALLILFPKKIILQSLINKFDSIDKETRKDMLQVVKLICQKRPERALSLAMENKDLESSCVTNCQDWIEIKKKQALKTARRLSGNKKS